MPGVAAYADVDVTDEKWGQWITLVYGNYLGQAPSDDDFAVELTGLACYKRPRERIRVTKLPLGATVSAPSTRRVISRTFDQRASRG